MKNRHNFAMTLVVFVSALGLAIPVTGYADHGYKSAAEILAVEHANVSLSTAISTAEASLAGRAIGAKTEVRHHKSRYEVAIATPKGIAKVKVDLATGKIADTDEPGFFDRLFGWDGKDIAKVAATLPVSLVNAVTKAEKATGGKAVEARLKKKGATPHYVVGVAVGTTIKWMAVDAKSGATTAVAGHHHDEDSD